MIVGEGTMAREQRLVRFLGTVQGVGFRYVTHRTAGAFDVTGYVKNLPDGSVECVVEGEAAEIDAFLAAMVERMGRYINRQSQQRAPHSGAYASFDVRF